MVFESEILTDIQHRHGQYLKQDTDKVSMVKEGDIKISSITRTTTWVRATPTSRTGRRTKCKEQPSSSCYSLADQGAAATAFWLQDGQRGVT